MSKLVFKRNGIGILSFAVATVVDGVGVPVGRPDKEVEAFGEYLYSAKMNFPSGGTNENILSRDHLFSLMAQ